MQSDQEVKTEAPAAKEPKVNKAEKLPRTKKADKEPKPLVGHVEAVTLDLQANATPALTFTLAPKKGAKRVITVEATGEARQTALSMLLAAKFEGKKLVVKLDGQGAPIARALEFRSRQQEK